MGLRATQGEEGQSLHVEGVAATAPDGNRAVPAVGPCGPPCITPAGQVSSQAPILSSLGPKGSVLALIACVVIGRLNHFRWIVPANGEVTLRVHFSSNDLGIFDQTFNFEVLGTRRQYQLYCRGVCTYPYICQDPK